MSVNKRKLSRSGMTVNHNRPGQGKHTPSNFEYESAKIAALKAGLPAPPRPTVTDTRNQQRKLARQQRAQAAQSGERPYTPGELCLQADIERKREGRRIRKAKRAARKAANIAAEIERKREAKEKRRQEWQQREAEREAAEIDMGMAAYMPYVS